MVGQGSGDRQSAGRGRAEDEQDQAGVAEARAGGERHDVGVHGLMPGQQDEGDGQDRADAWLAGD